MCSSSAPSESSPPVSVFSAGQMGRPPGKCEHADCHARAQGNEARRCLSTLTTEGAQHCHLVDWNNPAVVDPNLPDQINFTLGDWDNAVVGSKEVTQAARLSCVSLGEIAFIPPVSL
ncbi:hypothetical protein JOB18_023030 [Solea senegalensis]|uniref:Uncharacterized protein n=1 Tax=Solea senegalensis TaxID=28829 RepID=A0AAV6QWW4_SOLSE|nr:hypothetical protein JOB18_023030 [Solea senegalensis]